MSKILHRNPRLGSLLNRVDYSQISNTGVTLKQLEKGQAGNFDGSSFLNIDDELSKLATTTTGIWIAWVKPIVVNPGVSERIIGFWDTDGATHLNVNTYIDGKFRAASRINGSNKWALETDNAVFSDNTWLHVALVQDWIEPKLYVNWIAVDQSFTVALDKTTWFDDAPGTDNGRIGALNRTGAWNSFFFNWNIADVKLFDTSIDYLKIIEQDYKEFLAATALGVSTRNFVYEKPTDLENEVNVIGWKNTSAGTLAAPSTQVYWSFEVELNKQGAADALTMAFISDRNTTTTPLHSNLDWYYVAIGSNENLALWRANTTWAVLLFNTANSYLSTGVIYWIKINRNSFIDEFHTWPVGSFKVRIKGGAFGSSYIAVDVSGGSGSNAVTDNTYTTSSFSILDMDGWSEIQNFSRLRALDFNWGTGTYTRILYNSLIAWYNMIPNGSTLVDISGNWNNGTLNWAPLRTLEGMSFDWTNDFINIDTVVGDLASTTTGIWIAWVKVPNAAHTTPYEFIAFGDTNAQEDVQFAVQAQASGNRFTWFFRKATTIQRQIRTDSAPLIDNTWAQLALVQDWTEPKLYVNGIFIAQTFSNDTDKTAWFNDLTWIDNWRIGDRNFNSSGEQLHIKGEIADPKIYSSSANYLQIIKDDYNKRANQLNFYDDLRYAKADWTNIYPLGWNRSNGRYKIIENAGLYGNSKALECTSVWVIAFPSTQAYGTWEFDIEKTSDGAVLRVDFISDIIVAPANEQGYRISFTVDERINLVRDTGGGAVTLFTTVNSYLELNTAYRVKTTRTSEGIFTMYIKGGNFGDAYVLVDPSGGAGTNPVTDNTYKISNYTVLDYDIGDRIGNFKYSKWITI